MRKVELKDLDDPNLWVDPLKNDPRLRSGAVLLAEVIRDYVEKYNLLVNREDFPTGKLKGASYTMTPHPSEAWIIRSNSAGEDKEIPLVPETDSKGKFYLVPKNTLVFIRLSQQLRIPFYI